MPYMSPNASRWNIGHVGASRFAACVGHVDFMLFVSISFTLGSQHKSNFWWNMGIINSVKVIIFCKCVPLIVVKPVYSIT